ncbi:unnamed protein product [Effrenium voratum]|nr:unnamed protein product [Effrenium voratum]
MSKRRIGGHFGAALGAATKRQRDWRDEVEEEAPADSKADEDDDSEEAMLDPGTPLPSEEEEEAAPKVDDAPASAPDAAAEADAAPTDAPPEEAAAAAAAAAAAEAVTDAGPASASNPVVCTLEVIVGKNKVGELRILLPLGLDPDSEQRLSACVAPDGGSADFVAGVCGFGGHEIPGTKKEPEKGGGRRRRVEPKSNRSQTSMGAALLTLWVV